MCKNIVLSVIISMFFAFTSKSFAIDVNINDIEDDDIEVVEFDDSFEPINRAIFAFNSIIDAILLKPLALTYQTFVPTWGREALHSMLYNLYEPIYFVNHILQGEHEKAFDNMGRFLTNSTIGLCGIFDVASEAGKKPLVTDFGLTLKSYGIKSGPYIVMPFLGMSSLRDAPGCAIDMLIDPFRYYIFSTSNVKRNVMLTRYGLVAIDKRESVIKLMDQLDAASLDKYSTLRSIYFQKR